MIFECFQVAFQALLGDLEVRWSFKVSNACATLVDQVKRCFFSAAEVVNDDLARIGILIYTVEEYHGNTFGKDPLDMIERIGFARYRNEHSIYSAVEKRLDVGLFTLQ